MSKKTKYFKKVFQENADELCKETKQHLLTEEMFIPLAGEIYAKSKERYYTKLKTVSFEFAEWCAANYFYVSNGWASKAIGEKATLSNQKTTEQLFEIWKEYKHKNNGKEKTKKSITKKEIR